MAFQNVNVGTTANDGTGDLPRASFQKINANLLETPNLKTANTFDAGAPLAASAPQSIVQTWASVATSFVASLIDVTDTTSAATSLLTNWRVGGATKVAVTKGGKVGIGITTPNAWHQIGSGTYNGSGNNQYGSIDDAAYMVNRSAVDTANNTAGHGFVDVTRFSRSGVLAYCAFDARFSFEGTNNFDHGISLQSFPAFNSTGTLTNAYGYAHSLAVGSGTVTTSYGIDLRDATGAGVVQTQYGLRIASMSKGTVKNWAVYTEGATPSYFGGPVGFGVIPTQTMEVNGVFRISEPGSGKLDTSITGNTGTMRASGTVVDTLDVGGAGRLTLSTFSGGWQERARITSAGDMGIGTTAPSTKLHVAGPIRCATYTIATVPSATTVGAGAMIYVSDATGGANVYWSDGTNWRTAARTVLA
jgi:hypothetical protein